MPTTTILHNFEEWLAGRRTRGEISEATYLSYLNDASRVFEVLLLTIPPHVLEGYMKAAGYRRQYKHIIDTLRSMARPRKRTTYGSPREGQERLPGV